MCTAFKVALFVKQSLPLIFESFKVLLVANVRSKFAEFLKYNYLIRLYLLNKLTCVGSKYGQTSCKFS